MGREASRIDGRSQASITKENASTSRLATTKSDGSMTPRIIGCDQDRLLNFTQPLMRQVSMQDVLELAAIKQGGRCRLEGQANKGLPREDRSATISNHGKNLSSDSANSQSGCDEASC